MFPSNSYKQFQMITFKSSCLMLILSATFLVVSSVSADLDSGSAVGSADPSSSSDLGSPKRQYFIAPRIGRSGGINSPTSNAIWSALEEGSFNSIGQIQPHKGFPGPLKSSLVFLVGNRRVIGPRSGGLLPQARIGRRASPSGLMPQPRVGRRSGSNQAVVENDQELAQELLDGQQEVAVATLNDSSFNDALEYLVNVQGLVSAPSGAPENVIDKPVQRTAFVPRLGKREQSSVRSELDAIKLNKAICNEFGINCIVNLQEDLSAKNRNIEFASLDGTAAREIPILALYNSLIHGIKTQQGDLRFVEPNAPETPSIQSTEGNDGSNSVDILGIMTQHLKRASGASDQTIQDLMSPLNLGTKRVAFTPRIGRRR